MHIEQTDFMPNAIAENALVVHKVDRVCQHRGCIWGCRGDCFVDIEAVPDSLAVAGLGRHSGAALLAVGKDTLQKWAVSIRALPVGDPGLSDKEKRGGIFCEKGRERGTWA
jgi:hypothetical protein